MPKSKEFAVIGLGIFGLAIAQGLVKRNHTVLGVDIDKAIIEAYSGELTDLVRADTTMIETLKELAITDFNAVVVGIGDTEANILTVQLLREVGAKYILARAHSDTHEHILYKLGADKVVNPEKNMGDRIAMVLSGGLILDIIDIAEDYSVAGIKVGDKFNGLTLAEIEFRKRFGVTAIMVRRQGVSYPLNNADDKIFKGDVVFVTGSHDQLEKIREI